MALYETPKIFYQTSINANTAVEVTHFKSLSWANRTNNGGSFELIIPIDNQLPQTLNPAKGGYIRLSPGDTIMKIEKKQKIFDQWGNYWYKLGGRTRQEDDDRVRDAKNNNYFFRHKYNGTNAETYTEHRVGTPRTTIGVVDIFTSSTYEDNLGGFFEEVMIDPGTTEIPAIAAVRAVPAIPAVPRVPEGEPSTWGTIVVGQPKPIVNTVKRIALVSVRIGDGAVNLIQMPNGSWNAALRPDAGATKTNEVSVDTHELFPTNNQPTPVSTGSATGPNGRMDRVMYSGSWIANDVTTDVAKYGPYQEWRAFNITRFQATGDYLGSFDNFSDRGAIIMQQRTITLKTDTAYRAEMLSYLNSLSNTTGTIPGTPEVPEIPAVPAVPGNPAVPAVPATPPTFQKIYVEGGHEGYSFTIKSKGEVEKRYKVDFNIGDTIRVNDTRLGVVYTDVVSGAVETIDGNGYSVEIELGTLGATLEQRVQGVI